MFKVITSALSGLHPQKPDLTVRGSTIKSVDLKKLQYRDDKELEESVIIGGPTSFSLPKN